MAKAGTAPDPVGTAADRNAQIAALKKQGANLFWQGKPNPTQPGLFAPWAFAAIQQGWLEAQAQAGAAAAAQSQAKPPPSPFLTPEQLLQKSSMHRDMQKQIHDIDQALDRQRLEGEQQKSQADKSAKVDSAKAEESAIARGLFRSSIKDGDLYDIEATRQLRRKLFDDQLALSVAQADANKKYLQDWWDKEVVPNFNQMAVENARNAATGG